MNHGNSTPPWEDKEYPYKEFQVTIHQPMYKESTLESNDYNIEIDYDDDTGKPYGFLDISEIRWDKVYESEYYTIPALLEKLTEYIKLDMEKHITDKSYSELHKLLSSCSGWEAGDMEINAY